MSKKLIYSKNVSIENLFIGMKFFTLTISGRIYKNTRKFFRWSLKPRYTYTINIPYIPNPYLDGEYCTNKILKAKSKELEQELLDKIAEFKENE